MKKAVVALAVLALATASSGSYLPAVQPYGPVPYGYDSGLYGLTGYEGHGHYSPLAGLGYSSVLTHGLPYPYSAALPHSVYNNGLLEYYGSKYAPTVVQANVGPALKTESTLGLYGGHDLALGYGHGYNDYLPVEAHGAKYVAANPGAVHVASLPGHTVDQKSIVA